jgi:uracil-DNA glycosylase family 4
LPRDRFCSRCPLSDGAKNVCIWGDGPEDAKVVFVGRNPGYDEDRAGVPFVGRSGQLLRQLVEEAGFRNVYFTNLVKCVTPENRPPTKAEIAACSVYLREELDRIRPNYIFACGNEAWSYLTGRKAQGGILKEVGRPPVEINGSYIFPIPHPSYYVRQGGLEDHPGGRKARAEYLAAITAYFTWIQRLEGGQKESGDVETILCRSLSQAREAIQELSTADVLAVDVETLGLYPDGENRLLTIQVSPDGKRGFVFPWHHPENADAAEEYFSYVKEALSRLFTEKKVVAHHAQFDVLWLRKNGFSIRVTYDTKVAAHLINENTDTSLKSLAESLLGVPPYGLEFKDGEIYALQVLGEYGAKDAAYTHRLRELQLDVFRRDPDLARLMRRLIVPGIDLFVRMQDRGIAVDWQSLEIEEEKLSRRIQEIDEELFALLPEADTSVDASTPWAEILRPPDMVSQENSIGGDLLGVLLFDGLKFPVNPAWRTDVRGTVSVSSNRLEDLRDIVEEETGQYVLELLRERSDAEKTLGFFKGWRREAKSDGKLHPEYRWDATVTGRTSCRSPNLQQVPRNPEIRKLFIGSEGWNLISVDFSQIELRLIAHESQDPVMLAVFRDPNGDIHTETAAAVTGKRRDEITSEDRRRAKAVNFGFCYGMGAAKFLDYAKYSYGVRMSLAEAEAAREAYFSRYRKLREWQNKRREEAKALGFVRSILGRKRRPEKIWSPNREEEAAALRQAVNSPIQSAASDLAVMAALLLPIDEEEIRPLAFVHDAWLFEVRKDVVDKWCSIIRKVFEEVLPTSLKEGWGVELLIPLKVDISVGPNWGYMEKWVGTAKES